MESKVSETITAKSKLLDYQEKAVQLWHNRKVIPLLADLGLGKTAMALSMAKRSGRKRILCVIPKTTIDDWCHDIRLFTDFSYSIAIGNRAKRIDAIRGDVNVVLINFEGARICIDELKKLSKVGYFDCLIIDELARVRRYSEQTKALQEIAGFFPKIIGLSGLLIAESLLDVFNPFKILDGGQNFGTDFFKFREKYFEKELDEKSGFFKYRPTDYAKKVIPLLVGRSSCIIHAEDIGTLPEVVTQTRKITLSTEQVAYLKILEEEWKSKIPDETSDEEKLNYTMQVIHKAHQACSGFIYKENDETFWFNYNPKIQELNALIEENANQKFIVWYKYKAEKVLIEQLLEKLGKRICPEDDHKSFGDPKYDCFVASYKKHSQGINLPAARTAILFSRPVDYEGYYQALGRNRRLSSEHKLISYQVITSRHPPELLNDMALKAKKGLADLLKETKLENIWKTK